jgi:hypothetical protein
LAVLDFSTGFLPALFLLLANGAEDEEDIGVGFEKKKDL